MSLIVISLTSFGPYFISGIPRQVELLTNVPSIIFYTLDGTTPSYSSPVYLGAIDLPTDVSVRLRALAISGDDTGTLDTTFSTISQLTYPVRSEYSGSLGIAVDAYGVTPVLIDGYTVDDNNNVVVPARRSDYELNELEIKYSRTGPDGYGPGTIITMGTPSASYWQDDAVDPDASSPNDTNVFFNPRSLYIVIDGRDGYDDEAVYPINRPHGSTRDPVKYLQGKDFFTPSPYISGGIVRSCYNMNTGVAVAYYYDFNELRWIKSIQNFDTTKVPSNLGTRTQTGSPLVIKWVYNKRSMI